MLTKANFFYRYFVACGVKSTSSTSASRLDTIFSTNPTDVHGRLSLEGVLSFYQNCARKDPASVWKDLGTHGWLKNLRHETDVSAEKNAACLQPQELPPLSADAVAMYVFI